MLALAYLHRSDPPALPCSQRAHGHVVRLPPARNYGETGVDLDVHVYAYGAADDFL